MSTSQFSFKAKVKVGDQVVPITSKVVAGDNEAKDGVENGFLFKLDRQTGDPPVQVKLGEMIEFIEEKLNAGNLSDNSQVATMEQVFPGVVSSDKPFDSSNQAVINIESFEINSTKKESLFSFSVNVEGTEPDESLIVFPDEFAEWLKIKNLAISFSATKKSQQDSSDGKAS